MRGWGNLTTDERKTYWEALARQADRLLSKGRGSRLSYGDYPTLGRRRINRTKQVELSLNLDVAASCCG